ncbi:unnamed protein product [Linum trigynum]|uniref:Uncharacterized protein n=1 Tax=Linum trigynum TaxID=586398 RepID=A0AAV2F5H8_9ROSI
MIFSPSPKAGLPHLAKVEMAMKLRAIDEATELGSGEREQSQGRWRRILFLRGASDSCSNLPRFESTQLSTYDPIS